MILFALVTAGTIVRARAATVVFKDSIKEVDVAAQNGGAVNKRPFISRTELSAEETSAAMDFEVALKMRNFADLQARLTHGERIPVQEMSQKYNPTAADYKKVADWLKGEGFEILRLDTNHLAIFARGKVSQVQNSMHVNFARVTSEGQEYTSAVTAPIVPGTVSPLLVGINGLQPHLHMHKHAVLKKNSLTGTSPPYLPSQIAQAYNATGLYNSSVTGAGQTIAIAIDTFPEKSDLTSFWSTYGVNQSINNITFIQVVPGTLPAPEGEETLDTEWSSSIAPGAKVRVYAAQSLSFPSLDQVYQQIYADASQHPEYEIHQMSMSYGIGETYTTNSQVQTDDQYFAELASTGVTIFASSGDSGSTPGPEGAGDESGPLQASSPATDPNVTGVGGTSLTLNSNGSASSESVWNNDYGASGGGVSVYFGRPYWQTGTGVVSGTSRLTPDVACAADPTTGAVVVIGGSQTAYGGTSWSSPTWAAFCALINQMRANAGNSPMGMLGPYIYPQLGTSNFRDITAGGNATSGSGGKYSAGTGYDLATGVGVPNVQSLAQTLQNYTPTGVKAPLFTSGLPPNSVTLGSSYSFSFSASGFPAPTFAVTSGSLPQGIALNSDGALTGTPTAVGTYTATVTASNGVNPAANQSFSISVYNRPVAPTITNGPAPTAAVVSFPYSYTFTSTGYPVPSFAVTSGSLPPGVSLSSSGILSGTPSQAGGYSGTITASNGVASAASQNFSIQVQSPIAPAITNGPAPITASLGTAYSFAYSATGYPAPVFSVTSGSLPPGLTLSSAGILSGSPLKAGAYTGIVTAANGYGTAATQNFTITIQQGPAITNAPVSVPVALNSPFSFTYTATGYPTPTFSVTAGNLPPGMMLSSSGLLSGSPTATGVYSGTVTAANSVSSVNQSFSITVVAGLQLSLTMPSVVNEGDPDGTGTVTINSITSSTVTVQLTSSNPSAMTVPASISIPPGQTSAIFAYTILDNLSTYGSEATTITATSPGWSNGAQPVTITDNKTSDNWSSYGNGQAHTGVYYGSLLGGTFSQVWSEAVQTQGGLNQAVVAGGRVLVSSAGGGKLFALDSLSGALDWTYTFPSAFSISPATIYKGNAYVERSNNGGDTNLWAINADTGTLNWNAPYGSQWEEYLSPTVYQSIGVWMDGGTYGGLYGFNFNGTERSYTSELQYDEWTPTYYNGTIYSWVGGTFDAVNPANGNVLWSASATYAWSGWSMNCAAPIVNNMAFLNGNQVFTALNLTTHNVAWTLNGTFHGSPAVSNGRVYLISGSQVEVLDASTGVSLGTMQTGDTGLGGQPVVSSDAVVVSSSTATYLFSLENGALVQTIPYGGLVCAAGGNLYIAGSDGTVHVFQSNTLSVNFTSGSTVGVTSYGYSAVGQTLNPTLGFAPSLGTVLTVVGNTGTKPIIGTFNSLPEGGTISLTYNNTIYTFTASYVGGGGNDMTLTYTSSPPQAPLITDGPPPAEAALTFNYDFTYTTSGYPAPSFTVTAGALPPGLTLSSDGTISGIPTQTGTFSGTVTGDNGTSPPATQAFSITVKQPIAPVITDGPAPSGTVNQAYSFTYTATGYPSPTFSVSSGTLPPGLTLNSGGVLSGTPTQTGTYAGIITASNGYGTAAPQNFSIVIQQVPSITTAPVVVPILVNGSFTFTFTASGYPAPTFSVTSGSLPPGMALSPQGVLSGSPTAVGTYTGTITASNGITSVTQNFSITVQSTPALELVLPTPVNEGDPDGEGTLIANSESSSNLTVQLTSSNTGALTVPATVVIPAGQNSVSVPYTIIDNLNVYGTQTTTVTASASGWGSGSEVVTVTDNKTTDNWSSFGNGQAHTGVYLGNILGGTFTQAWSATFPSGSAALNQVAVSKNTVYVTPLIYFNPASLTALDATSGSTVWQYVFSPVTPTYGSTTYFSINPPTVYKGNVYVQQGQGLTSGNSETASPMLWSFNAATGQANWSSEFGAQWERYFAPTVYQTIGVWMDGGEYGGLYGFDFDGNQESYTTEQQYDQWTPTYYNGTIYTWVGGTFDAVDPSTGNVLWNVSEPYNWAGWSMNCAAPIANNLAFLNGGTSLTAVNVATHTTAWTISGTFTGTPALGNGAVYVISGSQVDVIDASSGAIESTLQTNDSGLTGQPVIANDAVIVSSASSTYLLNIQTGALAQTIPYGGPVSVAAGKLYLAGPDGTLRVYQSGASNVNFASAGGIGMTSYGYNATGKTLNIGLNFIPTPGTVLTVINNTSSSPIIGTFTNLPNGATINLTYDATGYQSAFDTSTSSTYQFVANYSSGDGNDLTLTLVSNAAPATVTLGGLSATFDGSPISATAMTNPASLDVVFTYDGISTPPTDAGSYTVVGAIDDPNYQGSATGTLVIAKAQASVMLGSLSTTFNGSPQSATATTVPANLNVTFTYNGSATAPSGSGSYAVIGTVNDPNYQGSTTGTLVIAPGAKLPATINLTNVFTTYDGSPQSATATTNPTGLDVAFTYNGSSTAPTAVGSYALVATINDPDYAGSTTGTFTINQGHASIALGNLAAAYNGGPQVVSATTNPAGLDVNLTYNGSGTAPVAVGSYAVSATVNSPDYFGSTTGTLTISKGTATVTWSGLAATYNGATHPATATTNPPGLGVTVTYNGKTTVPSAAGSYTVVGTINNSDYTGSSTGTLVISPATPTITLGGLSAVYNGKAHAATATTVPTGLPVTFAYQAVGAVFPTSQPPTVVGNYSVSATVNTADYAGVVTGTLSITPVPPLATTSTATAISPIGESVNGTVNPEGSDTGVTFQYGLTAPAYGFMTLSQDHGSGSTSLPVGALIGSLMPGTTYHYRIVASNAGGTVYGLDKTFTTLAVPTVNPTPATPLLSASGAQVGFAIDPNGVATSVYFIYSTDPDFGTSSRSATQSLGSGKVAVNVTAFLSGLLPNTTYYYQAVTTSVDGTISSTVQSFTTLGFDVTQVAATGQGAPGTTFNFISLGNAAIDDFDGAAFNAKLSSTNAASNDGIWANQGSSALALIAQTGATAPGTSGAVFATLGDPVLVYDGANEDVAFGGTLKVATGLVTTANENAVWASTGGTLGIVARDGGVAPGAGTAAFATFGSLGLSDSGGAIVSATLTASTATGVTTANNEGVWEIESGALTLMLRSGETTNTGKTIASFKFLPTESYVNGQTRGFGPTTGHLVANATYTGTEGTGIVKVITPATPLAVATSGDAAIGTTGGTFATFSSPAINDSDDTAFAATLTVGVGDAVKANAGGIWADNAGTRALVARLGQVAPGLSTNATFTAFSDPVFNDSDAVAFRATLGTGTGQATTATASGIWTNSGGGLALAAQQGTQAPGCPTGVNFLAFTELALDDVNGGGVIFQATLSGTGVTTVNNTGIFAVDNTGTLQLIVRTGDLIGGKTITALTFLPAEPTGNASVNGQARSFSSSTGDLVYNATFSDKSQAIFNVVFP